jgi:HEPN domain-containing protein
MISMRVRWSLQAGQRVQLAADDMARQRHDWASYNAHDAVYSQSRTLQLGILFNGGPGRPTSHQAAQFRP